MKNIFRIFKEKTWLVAIAIFIIALVLRVVAALKIAWRPDEIVYVDWIGDWFSKNFWQYFFQLKHNFYPPESNIFGNPPFSMWVLSFGVWLANKFGFSVLLGARLINIIIGSISVLLLFNLAKRWFNLRVAILSSLILALLPLVIVNNATAYLETVVVLLIINSLEYTFRYLDNYRRTDLFIIGAILGLSILTKFVVLPIIIGIILVIFIFSSKKKILIKDFIIFLIIIIATPVILWAGFRDIEHIKGLYYIYSQKLYSPYPVSYPLPIFRYYYLMLIGILPPLILLGIVAEGYIVIRNLLVKKFQKYKKEIIILGLTILYLAYNSVFAGYGAGHQLLPLIPFICLLAGLGLEAILNLRDSLIFKTAIWIIILIILVLPLTSQKPKFWGLYTSSFIGGSNRAFELYSTGIGGEGIDDVARYITENITKDSRIAVVGYDWIIKKYFQDYSTCSLFLDEGIEAAMSRGADYVLIPRPFLEGNQTKLIYEFSKIAPDYIFREKDTELYYLYKIDYGKVQKNYSLNIGNLSGWETQSINNTPEFDIDSEIKVKYNFTREFEYDDIEDSRLMIKMKNKINPRENQGIFFEAYGDGNNKLLSVMFQGDDKTYLEYSIVNDWHGWKNIYIPFEQFGHQLPDQMVFKPKMDQDFSFYLGVLSKNKISGEAILKSFYLANLEN